MLREAQSRGHLQDCLTQLKGAMEARGLHYEDLSGRPKNLCASLPPSHLPLCERATPKCAPQSARFYPFSLTALDSADRLIGSPTT